MMMQMITPEFHELYLPYGKPYVVYTNGDMSNVQMLEEIGSAIPLCLYKSSSNINYYFFCLLVLQHVVQLLFLPPIISNTQGEKLPF